MNILSLFDGIAGALQALKNINAKVDNYFASEIDKYAIQIAMTNHPEIKQMGDVCFLNTNILPEIDLLIGGSPCTNLSIAGDRKGLKGSQSQLFWEYVRILKEVKPKYFLLENVYSMKKSDRDIISKVLGVEPVLINSDRFVCQNRPRLYWTNIEIKSLPERPQWNSAYYQWRRNYFRSNKSGVCPCLTANMGTGGHNVPLKTPDLTDKLTPTEIETLQGFPHNYTQGISSSQRYKALGNSFTVPVVEHILKEIIDK